MSKQPFVGGDEIFISIDEEAEVWRDSFEPGLSGFTAISPRF